MTQAILIIVGIAIVVILLSRKTRETVVGICANALDQTVRKNINREKTFGFLRERGQASNTEIRDEFGFSKRSVVRYTNELERQGKVEQVGDTGRGVKYRLKR